MLNPIEKFKVGILHLNRDWSHWFSLKACITVRCHQCPPHDQVSTSGDGDWCKCNYVTTFPELKDAFVMLVIAGSMLYWIFTMTDLKEIRTKSCMDHLPKSTQMINVFLVKLFPYWMIIIFWHGSNRDKWKLGWPIQQGIAISGIRPQNQATETHLKLPSQSISSLFMCKNITSNFWIHFYIIALYWGLFMCSDLELWDVHYTLHLFILQYLQWSKGDKSVMERSIQMQHWPLELFNGI